MLDAETHLRALDGDTAASWLTVGRVLSALERQSRAAPSGSPWQDIVRERLEKAGQPVSAGHLYKIRRAHQFLEECAPEAVTQDPPPRISSVEVAERLYRLDPEAGKQALHDILGPKPITYMDIKRRYEALLEARPEMKSARHIGWDKRKPDGHSSEARDRTDRSTGEAQSKAEEADACDAPKPPAAIRQISEDLAEVTWKAAWNLARAAFEAQAAELQRRVAALEEERDLLKEDNRVLQEEAENLARKIEELGGYY